MAGSNDFFNGVFMVASMEVLMEHLWLLCGIFMDLPWYFPGFLMVFGWEAFNGANIALFAMV